MIAAIEASDGLVLAYAVAGALVLVAIWPRDASAYRHVCLGTGTATFALTLVAGSYLAPSAPAPHPPLPGPAPPVAVEGMAKLVPAVQRPVVGAFYRDLGTVALTAADIKTTDQLRDGYRTAGSIMKQVGRFPSGLDSFAKQASAMIQDAVGLESKPLDSDTRKAFAGVCLAIAQELGVTQ